MKKNRIGVLLSGRGSNFRAILKNIKKGYIKNAEISVVISDKSDADGLKYAMEEGIPSFFIDINTFKNREEYENKIIKLLKEYKVELVVLAGYMKLVGKNFIKNFENRIMNIHPALLPSFPGLHAQKKAIKYGVRYSGCTVHFVDEKTDNGPIILQAVVPVYQNDTEETLSVRILKEEHKIYSEAIKLFFEGKLKLEGRKVYIKGVK